MFSVSKEFPVYQSSVCSRGEWSEAVVDYLKYNQLCSVLQFPNFPISQFQNRTSQIPNPKSQIPNRKSQIHNPPSPSSFIVTFPAPRFIYIGGAQHDLVFVWNFTVGIIGDTAALLANGMQLGYIIGLGHNKRHLAKRVA